jgi:uncharacterized protein
MAHISFSWNHRKAQLNLAKHRVSFEEAQTVFYDSNAVQYFDSSHSDDEDRFLMLGMSANFRLLMVCHTYTEHHSNTAIRIISARPATSSERRHYKKEQL